MQAEHLPHVRTRPARCPKHGDYEQRCIVAASDTLAGIWSDCPACVAAGQAEAREAREAREAESRRAAMAKRLGDVAIPPRFAGCTFDNFAAELPEQQHALRAVRQFCAKFEDVLQRGAALTLTGPTGTGKTHLAAAALRTLTARGFACLYRLADAAVRHLKASYSPGCGYTEDQALAHLRMPDLLVLDEVGNQHNSEDEKRVLFAILNARYAYMRPTLVVSNLTSEQLRAWAGQAFHDRLLEAGLIVPCQWDSYRPRVGRKGGAA